MKKVLLLTLLFSCLGHAAITNISVWRNGWKFVTGARPFNAVQKLDIPGWNPFEVSAWDRMELDTKLGAYVIKERDYSKTDYESLSIQFSNSKPVTLRFVGLKDKQFLMMKGYINKAMFYDRLDVGAGTSQIVLIPYLNQLNEAEIQITLPFNNAEGFSLSQEE